MKSIYLALILIVIIIASTASTQLADRPGSDGWTVRKSDHFIVKYRVSDTFVDTVIRSAELYYHTIEKELELDRFDRFWTWDNRCQIIIYDDQQHYCQSTGMPEWSGGCVNYESKVIYTFPWANHFTETLLPHEIAHIVFREYVKDNPQVPLWIDEGIAQYHEQSTDQQMELFFDTALKNNMLLPMEQLMTLGSVTHDASDPRVALFYAQSKSLVSFMIDRYGQKRFAEFIRQLRSGKSVEDALRFAYPSTLSSTAMLEQKWLESVQ